MDLRASTARGSGHRLRGPHRGVSYSEAADGRARRILYGTRDGRLLALDANTGRLRTDFGEGGIVDLRSGVADRRSHEDRSGANVWSVIKELFDSVQTGPLFTPPGLTLTLTFPGTLGRANWSEAAFDPSRRRLYANVNEVGALGRMQPWRASPQSARGFR